MNFASATSVRCWSGFGKWTVHTPRSSRVEEVGPNNPRATAGAEAREPRACLILLPTLSPLVRRPENPFRDHYSIERIQIPAYLTVLGPRDPTCQERKLEWGPLVVKSLSCETSGRCSNPPSPSRPQPLRTSSSEVICVGQQISGCSKSIALGATQAACDVYLSTSMSGLVVVGTGNNGTSTFAKKPSCTAPE